MTDILTLAQENGFSHIGHADMTALVPLDEVRSMCSADRCGNWNKNWACPPACGTVDHARRVIARYNSGLLVQTTQQLADEFDYDGMKSAAVLHKNRFLNFARQARMIYPDCLPLTAGSCTICAKCTYPGKPCRYPAKRLSSMEAYGLFVSDVCIRSGLQYNYGPCTITYTSCVLYNDE
jgi:predicted metal-binding protein